MPDAALTIKLVKIPRWMTQGIDLTPKVTAALESIGSEIERRQGKGLGARRNTITRQTAFLQQRVFTSLHYPRTTGRAMQENQTGRFRGMAPRAINKYVVKPLEAEWAASQ